MRYGSKSENVKQLQSLLNALGTQPPLVVDGIFGKATDAAVRQFQSNSGIAVDGVVGLNTLEALKQAVAAKGAKAPVPSLDPTPAKIDINPARDTPSTPSPAAPPGDYPSKFMKTGGGDGMVAFAGVGLLSLLVWRMRKPKVTARQSA